MEEEATQKEKPGDLDRVPLSQLEDRPVYTEEEVSTRPEKFLQVHWKDIG